MEKTALVVIDVQLDVDDLEARLRQSGIGSLVIVGVQTDYCMSTTVRMAANLSFRTIMVDDASWTYDHRNPDGELVPAETVHRVNMTSLSDEFAEIVDTEKVLGRLERDKV